MPRVLRTISPEDLKTEREKAGSWRSDFAELYKVANEYLNNSIKELLASKPERSGISEKFVQALASDRILKRFLEREIVYHLNTRCYYGLESPNWKSDVEKYRKKVKRKQKLTLKAVDAVFHALYEFESEKTEEKAQWIWDEIIQRINEYLGNQDRSYADLILTAHQNKDSLERYVVYSGWTWAEIMFNGESYAMAPLTWTAAIVRSVLLDRLKCTDKDALSFISKLSGAVFGYKMTPEAIRKAIKKNLDAEQMAEWTEQKKLEIRNYEYEFENAGIYPDKEKERKLEYSSIYGFDDFALLKDKHLNMLMAHHVENHVLVLAVLPCSPEFLNRVSRAFSKVAADLFLKDVEMCRNNGVALADSIWAQARIIDLISRGGHKSCCIYKLYDASDWSKTVKSSPRRAA
jgi:hypothetical protein